MSYAVMPMRLGEHREALARLWAENMADPRIAAAIPRRMSWLYDEAPDGPPTTLIATHVESGEAVGCGSFLPRPAWVDGRRVHAGVLCDFAVARAHRVGGAALVIQRALVEAARGAGLELLYGYPNSKSVAVFKRIGYRVVGTATTWVKPLRSAYKLRSVVPWGPAASACALPLDLGLRALDALRAARRPRVRAGPVSPDARADALWERTRARPGVQAERSSGYLAWRYDRFTTAEHRSIGAFRDGEGDRLDGYAVYAIERNKAFLRDLVAERLDEGVEALLLSLCRALRSERVASLSVSYVGPPEFGERLRSVGFIRRPEARSLLLHPDPVREDLRERVFQPSSWFMLEGELDI